tara:strand:- start:2058 stop:2852 length:795 start_codon:yes stop_codon:yes gene_type:complete
MIIRARELRAEVPTSPKRDVVRAAMKAQVGESRRAPYGRKESRVHGKAARKNYALHNKLFSKALSLRGDPDSYSQRMADELRAQAKAQHNRGIRKTVAGSRAVKREDESNVEEGKIKDFLRNAALVGVAAGAGRMGANTASPQNTEPARSSQVQRNPMPPKAARLAQVGGGDAAFPSADDKAPKRSKTNKMSKAILARIKSIRPKGRAPFSQGYRTTSAPEGNVSADIQARADQHSKINPKDPHEKSKRRNILTAWKKKTERSS